MSRMLQRHISFLQKRWMIDGITGEAFNFGNDTPLTVREITNEMLSLMSRWRFRANHIESS